MESMYGVGTIFGLILTVVFLDTWVDFYRVKTPNLNPEDAAWVGAWWAPLILAVVLFVISAIPFFFFPKRLPKSSAYVGDDLKEAPMMISEDKTCENTPNGRMENELEEKYEPISFLSKFKISFAGVYLTHRTSFTSIVCLAKYL